LRTCRQGEIRIWILWGATSVYASRFDALLDQSQTILSCLRIGISSDIKDLGCIQWVWHAATDSPGTCESDNTPYWKNQVRIFVLQAYRAKW
jgi:hypothetical protein